MGQLVRVTDLTAEPVVGEFYLVPTVAYRYGNRGDPIRVWPVFPSFHEDKQHLNYPWPHYHIDPRFLDARVYAKLDKEAAWLGRTVAEVLQAQPLHHLRDGEAIKSPPREEITIALGVEQTDPHPAMVWRRRKCHRPALPYAFGHLQTIHELQGSYAGQTCPKGKAGWVCPHKAYPLGSHTPDADGVITCPLHGLRIYAATGKVLAPPPVFVPPKLRPTKAERLAEMKRDPETGRPVI